MKKIIILISFALISFQSFRNYAQPINNILKSSSLDFQVTFNNDYLSNFSGGIATGSDYMGLIKPDLNIDLDKTVGLPNANIFISAIGVLGNNFNEKVGTEQGVDNIEAYDTWKIYEFWIEQNLLDNNLSVKFGLYDLNTEFDVRLSSLAFLNPSQAIGPDYSLTGKNGPSIYPTTSLALRVSYKNNSGVYSQLAALDGVPGNPNNPNGTQIILNKNDGLLLNAEIGYADNEEDYGKGYQNFFIGGWYYSGKFEMFSQNDISNLATFKRGNFGIYFSGEKFIWSEIENSNQGLAAFFRLGFSDKDVNAVNRYIGLGFNYKGLIPGRDTDEFGISLCSAHNRIQYIHAQNENVEDYEFENIIEITYLFYYSNWLKIQPDVQYVFYPTFCQNNNFCFISGIRAELHL